MLMLKECYHKEEEVYRGYSDCFYVLIQTCAEKHIVLLTNDFWKFLGGKKGEFSRVDKAFLSNGGNEIALE